MSTILDALRKAEQESKPKSGLSGGGGPPESDPPGRRRRRIPRWVFAVAAVAVLGVAFVGGITLDSSNAPQPEPMAVRPVVGGEASVAEGAAPAAAPPEQLARVTTPSVPPARPEAAPPPAGGAQAARVPPGGGDRVPYLPEGSRLEAARRGKPLRSGEGTRRADDLPSGDDPASRRARHAAVAGSRRAAIRELGQARREEREASIAANEAAQAGAANAGARGVLPPPAPPSGDAAGAASSAVFGPAPGPAAGSAPAAVAAVAPQPEGGAALEPAASAGSAPGPEARPPGRAERAAVTAPPRRSARPPAGTASPAPPEEQRALALRRPPNGAPNVAINILGWSPAEERRFAFVSIDGGSMTQVREGDEVSGLTVKRIYQEMIEFGQGESSFLLRAN